MAESDREYLDYMQFTGQKSDGAELTDAFLYYRDVEARASIETINTSIEKINQSSTQNDVSQLQADVSNLAFQLALKGYIDAGDMKSVTVDRFDSQDSVTISSGIYADSAISI